MMGRDIVWERCPKCGDNVEQSGVGLHIYGCQGDYHLLDRLRKAVRSFQNADTEYRRAKYTGEQPRLNKAGTRYVIAKHRMFKALAAETPNPLSSNQETVNDVE